LWMLAVLIELWIEFRQARLVSVVTWK